MKHVYKHICLLLLCLMLASASAEEVFLSNASQVNVGTTAVTLSIPASYSVRLVCGAHGSCMVKGEVVSGEMIFSVERGQSLSVTIVPDAGYYLSDITQSTTEGIMLKDNILTIDDSMQDVAVALAFEHFPISEINLNLDDLVLCKDMMFDLKATDENGNPITDLLDWNSDNPSVASVSSTGVICAQSNGHANIACTIGSTSVICGVTVRELASINYPKALISLSDEAMMGNTGIEMVVLPENVDLLGNKAFAGCSNLRFIVIPPSVTNIGQDCFDECNYLTILCEMGSYAEQYAKAQNVNYQCYTK